MSGELCTPPPAVPRGHGGVYPEPGYPPVDEFGGRGTAAPPRPHSADFLEWEQRHSGRPSGGGGRLPAAAARPKSSLARYQPPVNDYWSEEGYANKMRQAAYSGGVMLPGAAGPGPRLSPGPSPSQGHVSGQVPAQGQGQVPPGTPGMPMGAATLPGHSGSAPPETPPPGTHSLGRDLERVPRGSGFMRSASARFARQKARELDMMNTSLPDDPNDGREGTRKKIQQVGSPGE